MSSRDDLLAIANNFIESTLLPIVNTAITQTKAVALEQKKKQFQNTMGANDWDSEAFPNIKRTTVRIKQDLGVEYPNQPLFRTGELMESLTINPSSNSLELEDYASSHEAAHAWLEKKGGAHDYMKFSDEEMQNIAVLLFQSICGGLSDALK